jgi:bacterioferritin
MAQVQVSDELKELLNQAIARELQVSIQYMWQHVQWRGVKGFAVKGELRSISIAEMKHAEAIAERLFYLGATPTTKPEPIIVDEGLADQLRRDLADEEGALELYRRIIQQAVSEGDFVTEDLFKGILAEEEDHHDTFQSLLEEL